MKHLIAVLVAVGLLHAAAASAGGPDSLRLRDGTVVEGHIRSGADRVVITLPDGGGTLTLPRRRIDPLYTAEPEPEPPRTSPRSTSARREPSARGATPSKPPAPRRLPGSSDLEMSLTPEEVRELRGEPSARGANDTVEIWAYRDGTKLWFENGHLTKWKWNAYRPAGARRAGRRDAEGRQTLAQVSTRPGPALRPTSGRHLPTGGPAASLRPAPPVRSFPRVRTRASRGPSRRPPRCPPPGRRAAAPG